MKLFKYENAEQFRLTAFALRSAGFRTCQLSILNNLLRTKELDLSRQPGWRKAFVN